MFSLISNEVRRTISEPGVKIQKCDILYPKSLETQEEKLRTPFGSRPKVQNSLFESSKNRAGSDISISKEAETQEMFGTLFIAKIRQ